MSTHREDALELLDVARNAHEGTFGTAAATAAVAQATLALEETTRINSMCWMLDHVEGEQYERLVDQIASALGIEVRGSAGPF